MSASSEVANTYVFLCALFGKMSKKYFYRERIGSICERTLPQPSRLIKIFIGRQSTICQFLRLDNFYFCYFFLQILHRWFVLSSSFLLSADTFVQLLEPDR